MKVKKESKGKRPMRKSLYSLMLDDGVVAAIDRLAYLQSTTRSGLVNRILAEYASYITPEQRIREAFGSMRLLLDREGEIRLLSEPSDTMLSLRSALLYKYNPTVRYSVELYRTEEGDAGELRVSLRTQNEALIAAMMRFYRIWDSVERTRLQAPPDCRASAGKYLRVLTPCNRYTASTAQLTPNALGELIVGYIRTLDHALKLYFRHLEDTEAAIAAVEAVYTEYIRSSEILL